MCEGLPSSVGSVWTYVSIRAGVAKQVVMDLCAFDFFFLKFTTVFPGSAVGMCGHSLTG